jgi:Spy/CpxP family protein refolding chaperone
MHEGNGKSMGEHGSRRGHGMKHGHGGPGMDFLHPRMLKKLDLSEDQLKALKEQRLAVQKKKIQLQSDKAIVELDLPNVLSTAPVKEAEAKKVAEKIADVDRKALLLRVETMSRFLAGLTPEQHRKVMDYQADMRERRKTWREEMKKDWKRGDGKRGPDGD